MFRPPVLPPRTLVKIRKDGAVNLFLACVVRSRPEVLLVNALSPVSFHTSSPGTLWNRGFPPKNLLSSLRRGMHYDLLHLTATINQEFSLFCRLPVRTKASCPCRGEPARPFHGIPHMHQISSQRVLTSYVECTCY